MTFSAKYRSEKLPALSSIVFDICIIGGGITGAGIALDAASRGLNVVLLEKSDFGSGTSSRSTKLIHGGLRYLKQFEFVIVSQVGRERAILHQLAPHLVVPEKMLLPFTREGTFGKHATSLGLWIYDLLAGVRGDEKRRMYSRKKIIHKEPLLDSNAVLGGGIYAEYRTDDARLTMEIIKTAHQYGAECLNYCEVKSFNYHNGEVSGLVFEDKLDGKQYPVHFKSLVNAAGPWVDELRTIDHSLEGKHLFLTKGVHIVVPFHKLPLRQSIYFDVPDGRMIFAIPRGEITYIGTTDTPYTESKDKVFIENNDLQYLVNAVNLMFPKLELFVEDIISAWAGLRPLIFEPGKSASELSRKDEIFVSSSGMITIAGGKLTGYRRMAEKVVDLILKKLSNKRVACKTKNISLCNGVFSNYHSVEHFKKELEVTLKVSKLPASSIDYLVHLYGGAAKLILDEMNIFEGTPELKLILSEVKYCLENEMVLTLPDFFVRRTGRLFFNPYSIQDAIVPVAVMCGNKLGWTNAKYEEEVKTMQTVFDNRLVYC